MTPLTLLTLLLIAAPSLGTRLNFLTDRDIQDDSYIVGGSPVDPVGKWPWQGSLLTFFFLHQCGCSLIGADWAITAAHCTTTPSFFVWVMFGAHDIITRRKGDPTSYRIKRKIRHPDWSGSGAEGYPNDIALIQLKKMVNTDSPYIGIVDMAQREADFVGAECFITGWGLKRGGAIFTPNNLREAPTTAMTNAECNETWTDLINDGHICVGGRGVESGCMGDSGGPLVCKLDDIWVLAGATSWGSSSCDPASPSVYTRVSYFRDWITEVSDGEL